MNKLLTKALKKYDIDSLLHVGAHKGRKEIDLYQNLKIKNVLFIEPIKIFADELYEKIKNIENFSLLQIALGSKDEKGEIFVADAGETDNSGSSSILEPRKSNITFSNKETIEIKKYTSLNIKKMDCAVIDTQGYELEVLKGFEEKINDFKFLIVEFSTVEGYIGRVVYKDLNKYLNNKNFYMVSQWKKVARLFKSDILGSYGDALYVNGNLVSPLYKIYSKTKYRLLNNFFSEFLNYFSKIYNYKKIVKIIFKM